MKNDPRRFSLQDLLVWRSFDRRGFVRHRRVTRGPELPEDLRGRRFLVTGANQGLGRALVLGLARRGASLDLLCRRGDAGEAILREVREAGVTEAQLWLCDLSDLRLVQELAANLSEGPPLHGLIHNAGLLPGELACVPPGVEVSFAVHVLAPWILTRALEARLSAEGARVVMHTSGGALTQRLDVASLTKGTFRRGAFDGTRTYAQTKRAQIVLAEELHRAWSPRVRVLSAHPGWVDTHALRSSLPAFHERMREHLRTPEEGADGALWLATADLPESWLERGGLWFDRAPARPHPLPWTRGAKEEGAVLLQEIERVVQRLST